MNDFCTVAAQTKQVQKDEFTPMNNTLESASKCNLVKMGMGAYIN
jgi:hypothetical protein